MKADLIVQETIDDPNEILEVEIVDQSPMTEIETFPHLVRRDRQLRLKRDLQLRAQPRQLVRISRRIRTNDESNLSHLVEEGKHPLTLTTGLDHLLKTEVALKIGIETDQARTRDINRRRILDTNPNRIRDPNHAQDPPKIWITSWQQAQKQSLSLLMAKTIMPLL